MCVAGLACVYMCVCVCVHMCFMLYSDAGEMEDGSGKSLFVLPVEQETGAADSGNEGQYAY